ncbi:MAG: hypothetical protein U1G07_18375 [Verrucomicrobiota bacterium]
MTALSVGVSRPHQRCDCLVRLVFGLCLFLCASGLPGRAGDFAPGVPLGTVQKTDLAELSGLTISRNNPGVVWVHNDRARGQIHAVSVYGNLLATWDLSKTVDDMEDIALGPGPLPQLHYLYAGDIGDNASARANIRIFRAAEPSVYPYQATHPPTPNFPRVERVTVNYPDGAHNAEALMVDSQTGDVYIATKEPGQSRIYRLPSSQFVDGATVVVSLVQQIDFDIVSAGDISSDGSEILLRQEEYAEWWRRSPGQTVAQALSQVPVFVPVIGTPLEPNGEGIAFDPDGLGYYTVSEGVNPVIYFFARTNGLPKISSRTLVEPGSAWRYKDDGLDQGTAWRTPAFSDATWASGLGQFGYGEDDERTVVRYGSNKDRKFTTTYFRKQFSVTDPASLSGLTVRIVYDDGVAVYLNGTELLRKNLPADAGYADPALASGSDDENLWQTFQVSQPLLAGTNTLAVEVHRYSPSEGDLSFDLQLFADLASQPLRFLTPPRRIAADRLALDFAAPDANEVLVDRSTNLVDWVTLGPAPVTSGTGTLTVTIVSAASEFYRLRQ